MNYKYTFASCQLDWFTHITTAESSIATILNYQYHQLFLLGPKAWNTSSSLFALYISWGHTRTKAHTHAHPHTHVYPSCYRDIPQLLGEWVIFVFVYVCFLAACLLLRQLAIAILQEWTMTFDSITADWIGSPPAAGWLPSTIPCGDTARATHCLQSPLLTPSLPHPSQYPSTSPAPIHPSVLPSFSSPASLCFS